MIFGRNKKAKGKVFVGLSGGVDSSVSAGLLKKQGYDVVGVFIKTWHPDFVKCTWRDERRDAMRVAGVLDIPFLTFDFEKEYKKEVADYMIESYRKGLTPNPDVMCNKVIKFGSFLDKALGMGADYIATGHYVRKNGDKMLKGLDKNKDQSYFLWTLTPKQLRHSLFTVGGYQKDKVRKLAKKFGLPTADKKDSQGVCFLGEIELKEFLSNYIKPIRGDVLNKDGENIGYHDGATFLTIGQRHGFVIAKKGTDDSPMFIVNKDMKKNTITVADKSVSVDKKIIVRELSWISGIEPEWDKIGKNLKASIRYRENPKNCVVKKFGDRLEVIFEKSSSGVSSGQSLVFYNGDICLGGGVIG